MNGGFSLATAAIIVLRNIVIYWFVLLNKSNDLVVGIWGSVSSIVRYTIWKPFQLQVSKDLGKQNKKVFEKHVVPFDH